MSDSRVIATQISQSIEALSTSLTEIRQQILAAETQLAEVTQNITLAVPGAVQPENNFVFLLTVFVLACFLGYYVVWRVTPSLHSPLMSLTNAISSVVVVGAMVSAGAVLFSFSKFLGFLAVFFASLNLFGGFIVTERMLSLFKKDKPKKEAN